MIFEIADLDTLKTAGFKQMHLSSGDRWLDLLPLQTFYCILYCVYSALTFNIFSNVIVFSLFVFYLLFCFAAKKNK